MRYGRQFECRRQYVVQRSVCPALILLCAHASKNERLASAFYENAVKTGRNRQKHVVRYHGEVRSTGFRLTTMVQRINVANALPPPKLPMPFQGWRIPPVLEMACFHS